MAPDFTLPCSPPLSSRVCTTQLSTVLFSVLPEAKVGCLSLSWQPAVEERRLTSLSSPPSRCHHPPLARVGKDDDDICSFSHAQHSVYGACKGINRWRRQKGADDDCFSAPATPTLDTAQICSYMEHTYIHIWNTNTFTLNENTVTCKYIHNHGDPFYIYETFIFVANYMSSTLHPCW